MIRKTLICALLLLPVPAFAAPSTDVNGISCDIRIDFETTTIGIDGTAYTNIMKRILELPAITEKHVENIGSSGERTLCLKVEPGQVNDVYKELRAHVTTESKVYKTTITSREGKHFSTKYPEKFQRNPYFN